MDAKILFFLISMLAATTAWSLPFYPVPRVPLRITRFAPPSPPRRVPYEPAIEHEHLEQERPKRGHDYDHEHDHDSGHRGTSGVTGPVHTFVKTDKNANYKWGVRHHVGDKYAS